MTNLLLKQLLLLKKFSCLFEKTLYYEQKSGKVSEVVLRLWKEKSL